MEADDLLVGFFLPVGVITEYLLFERGDVMVEEGAKIEDLLEKGNGYFAAAVVEDD